MKRILHLLFKKRTAAKTDLENQLKGTRKSIVIKNRKIVIWKDRPYCWYFRLNLKYLGWPYREYNSKNDGFCEILLIENDFEAVLCCYYYDVNTFEGVHKIATDQKDYHKTLLVCYSFLNSQDILISNSEKGWLFTYDYTSSVVEKAAEVAQEKEQ